MMQCVAVWCSVWQYGVVCCSMLQCVAVCCSVSSVSIRCLVSAVSCQNVTAHSFFQIVVAVRCDVLLCVAVCCSMLYNPRPHTSLLSDLFESLSPDKLSEYVHVNQTTSTFCMYVHMCVCMYVRLHVCMWLGACIYMYAYTQVCIHVCVYIHMY